MKNTVKLACWNRKGGIGKTTSIINIAYNLQKHGKKILVCDCDTQENCYTFFLAGKSPDNIKPTDYENIFHTTWERYNKIDESQLADFAYILFDLPPALDDGVKEILGKCDTIFVPVALGAFEVAGLAKVTNEIQKLGVRLGGIFITIYKKGDADMLEAAKSALNNRIMQTIIHDSQAVRESQKLGLPLEPYFIEKGIPKTATNWKIVYAYEELTAEILHRTSDEFGGAM